MTAKSTLLPNKEMLGWLAVCAMVAFLITVLLAVIVEKKTPHAHSSGQSAGVGTSQEEASSPVVPVYLSKEQKIDRVSLEDYVRGVVAAEVPITFEKEALKAQALAARTYIVRRILDQDHSNVPVKDALVTDTITHQAYWTVDQMKKTWGDAFDENWNKIDTAVKETKGLILTYGGKPIQATFFSTSNGYTEDAEDYWGLSIPYLRSVPCPWDRSLSPKYKETVSFTLQEFESKLGVSRAIPAATLGAEMKIIDMTAGHRIGKIRIAGTTFTGRDVRERLGLNSSQFDWRLKGGTIEITTTGYGHGVGMSQWGADGMAKEGKTAEQIVKYFYTGISIEPSDRFLS